MKHDETISFLISDREQPPTHSRHCQDHLPLEGLQPEPLGRGHPQLLPD